MNHPKVPGSPTSGFRRVIAGISLLVAASLAAASPSLAAQANLTWNPTTTYTDGSTATVSGYKVYTGTAPGNYSQNMDVGNVTAHTMSGLNDATTYYFAVTAYDASGTVSSLSNEASFTTPAAPAPAATYTLTASAGTGGTISPSGAVAISQGLSQTFTVTPATGNIIADVKVDGVSVGAVAKYSFSNVSANHTIAASFASAPAAGYTITASAGTGGAISPSGSVAVSQGTSQAFTISPAAGYGVADVKVDGVSVGAVTTYSFTNVTANHTIQASFTATSGQLVFATNSGGSQYSSPTGLTYTADNKYSGGTVGSSTATISGTTEGTVYQTSRYGTTFGYNIPVANGNYNVTLKFAEITWTAPGQRVFSVAINGRTVISNLDIYATAGKNTAYDVVVPVAVTNGTISINFTSQINYAKVSGIVVKTM